MSAKQVSIYLPCPVCQGAMTVRELECTECAITVRGDFGKVNADAAGVNANAPAAIAGGTAQYGALTTEQAQFMETFLRCRGIIRDVEAALGISYPTVRARLDALLSTLGLSSEGGMIAPPPAPPVPSAAAAPPAQPEKPSVKDILSRLDSGSLDAKAALEALRGDPSAGSEAGSN